MTNTFLIILLVVATASSGAFFKPGTWYDSLAKPDWTPPGWVFPVVWGVLYTMIAVSGYLILQAQGWGLPLALWVLQLIFNAGWSGFFFGLRRMDIAFVDVCLLWLSIALLIVVAWSISQWAALLLVPYLVWVTIAAALNLRVWQMNRDEVPG